MSCSEGAFPVGRWTSSRGWRTCLIAILGSCFLSYPIRAAEDLAQGAPSASALQGRCPGAKGGLRHHGLQDGPVNWKIAQLTQLNSAPGTNSAHIIWDTALYDSDQTVVRTALNVFDNRKIPRALSVEELIWIQARIGTASWSEARAWAYILANSGLATNALLLSIIADRYVAEVRAPPAILTTYGVASAYIQGEALFYHQWLRVFRLSDHALSRRILRVKHRQAPNRASDSGWTSPAARPGTKKWPSGC